MFRVWLEVGHVSAIGGEQASLCSTRVGCPSMTKCFSNDSCSCVWLMLACTGAHIYYDVNDLIGGYDSVDICLQEDQDLKDGSVCSLQLKHWPFQVGYSLLLRLV